MAYEGTIARRRDTLTASNRTQERRQASRWHMVRLDRQLPDGRAVYLHVITPAVPEPDYRQMRTAYDEFPPPDQRISQLFTDAVAQITGRGDGPLFRPRSQFH